MPGETPKTPIESEFAKIIRESLQLTLQDPKQVSEINRIIGGKVNAVFTQHGLSTAGKNKQTIYAIRGRLLTQASIVDAGIRITDFSIDDVRKVVLQSKPGLDALFGLGSLDPGKRVETRALSLEVYIRHEKHAITLTSTSDSQPFEDFYQALRSAIAAHGHREK